MVYQCLSAYKFSKNIDHIYCFSMSNSWPVGHVVHEVLVVVDSNGLLTTAASWVFTEVTLLTALVVCTPGCNGNTLGFVLCTTLLRRVPLWTDGWALWYDRKLADDIAILASVKQCPLATTDCQQKNIIRRYVTVLPRQRIEFIFIN